MKKKSIVVIGGGTGTYTVLTGLKKYPVNLTAIVSMADDGGSTGILRDELGVLPPGDVRSCLVALSTSDTAMRELMNYRFESGKLKGHSFGNLFLSALEKVTKNFDKAIEKASEILRLQGNVIPVTLDKVRLFGYEREKLVIRHESGLYKAVVKDHTRFVLRPNARANPRAVEALYKASAIIIGPGNFYSSLVPNLLVSGIPEAIRKSKAKKIYVCNLMTNEGYTDDWTVTTFTKKIEQYLGAAVDYVIYNSARPGPTLLKKYALKGERPVKVDTNLSKAKFIGASLMSKKIPKISASNPLRARRTLIRHNPDRIAKLIMGVV